MFTDQDMEEMELGIQTAVEDMRLAVEKCGPEASRTEILVEFDRLTDLRYDVMASVPE